MNKKEESIHVRCSKQEKDLMKSKAQMINCNNLSNFIILSTKAYKAINPMKLNYQCNTQINPLTVKFIGETARFIEELDTKYCFTDEDLYELNRRFSQSCQL